MKRPFVYLALAVGHLLLVGAYWFLSSEEVGTVLLLIFGIAMALMGWILVPTVSDVGPTAPVDPEWHERRS